MERQTRDRLVRVGVLGRPHGLRGEVHLRLDNPGSTAALSAEVVTLERPGGERAERRVLSARAHGRSIRLALEGVVGRDEAERLRGVAVLLPRAELPEPEEGEYYDADLVGLAALSPEGLPVGRVVEVDHPPASDVLTIELGTGELVDLPFVEAFVGEVDLEARTVVVDLPEGLPVRPGR